jgi:RimJ/RimL family protein N-acetyltransferase
MARLPDHIETERLVLRRWTTADAPALGTAIAESLEHLRPWMPWAGGEPVALDDRARWIEQGNRDWEAGGDVVLGILLPDGTVVGGTGLHRRAGPDTLEIGYWIHVDHARRGYVTEAVAALTDAAFTVTGIEHVEIHHDVANVASRGVPEKLGYTLIGEVEPTTASAPGEDGVHWCWRVDADAWRARRVRPPA